MTEASRPQVIVVAEAIFDAVQPSGINSTIHPFERWVDQTQVHFVELAKRQMRAV